MEQIRTWAIVLCFAAVAASLIRLAAPEGSVQKAFRCVTGLFFLSCVMSPFLQETVSFTLFDLSGEERPDPAAQDLIGERDRQIEQAFCDNLEQSLIRLLEEDGIEPEKICVRGHFLAEEGIVIECIEIHLFAKDAKFASAVREKIKKAVGTEPRMWIQGELL